MKNPSIQSPPVTDAESRDVVVVSTRFDVRDKAAAAPQPYRLTADSERLLQKCVRILRIGGLLFVYGTPRDLPFFAEWLLLKSDKTQKMIFKHWIALDIDAAPRADFLKPSHQGLLMFLKSKPGRKTQSPFHLNSSAVRTPHQKCRACGLSLKDWGGKTHLMHAKGTVLSDVWRDLPRRPIRDCTIPADVLERIRALTRFRGVRFQHIEQHTSSLEINLPNEPDAPSQQQPSNTPKLDNTERKKLTIVCQGDCVSLMKLLSALHPEGVFDMVFADPPYNLKKLYKGYTDALAEQHYIEWCHAWLEGMVETLKPGGSLLVLNLPKWAIYHAAFLNRRLEFRHWIVWDATGEPRGKLTPSHYALLYYTKPGGKPTFNYAPLGSPANEECVLPPVAPHYCLRPKCLKLRKESGDDEKVELSEVWFDIQRIKHKKHRDDHPCQLPEKLMERIVLMTTRRGDLVFDPFCGAGTTAIAATKLQRDYVVVDVDSNYVNTTEAKLTAMREHFAQTGEWEVPRKKVKKRRRRWSQAGIVRDLKKLTRKLGRVPTEEEIESDSPGMLQKIDAAFTTRGAALKRCKLALA